MKTLIISLAFIGSLLALPALAGEGSIYSIEEQRENYLASCPNWVTARFYNRVITRCAVRVDPRFWR